MVRPLGTPPTTSTLADETSGVGPPIGVGAIALLAVAAGVIDGYTYLRLGGVFGANVGADVLFMGLGLGTRDPALVGRCILALAAFVVAVGIAGVLVPRRPSARTPVALMRALLSADVLLLLLVVVLDAVVRPGRGNAPGWAPLLVVPAAAAMGVQAAAVRDVAGVAASSVHMSGEVDELARAVAARLLPASLASHRATGRVGAVVGAALVGYLAGAVVIGFFLGAGHAPLMLAPLSVLVMLLVSGGRTGRSVR
jgi:uncharacterized membrane protein YoaK (UPF0700 family)